MKRSRLWFDVESRYEATKDMIYVRSKELWFDVESRYEATFINLQCQLICCGLMQNQDMKRVGLKLKETTAPVTWWEPLKK